VREIPAGEPVRITGSESAGSWSGSLQDTKLSGVEACGRPGKAGDTPEGTGTKGSKHGLPALFSCANGQKFFLAQWQ